MLLKNIDTAFLQDSNRSVEHGVDILVRDGEIVEVGEDLSDEEVIDCSGKIALPGLINTHSHTPNILTRGWSDDKTLFPWLEANEKILQYADRSDRKAGARLSSVLMLETGTTTVNDMWSTYLVEEFEEIGIRVLMGNGLAELENTDPDAVQEEIEINRRFIEDYQNHSTIHPTVPVHSIYRSTEELLRTADDLAAKNEIPFHIHVSETRKENNDCLDERGMTPTAWLNDLGVLDRNSVLAHCVHLNEDDRDMITDNDAGVAHCASANLKLGSGIADIPSMDGIPVGIGTDEAASNNTLNMFREGRTAALIHKREDPGVVSAQRILDMMTCEAATVLNIEDKVGSLEKGKRADIVLIDKKDPTLHPYIGDKGLLSNIIYSFHGKVDTTIVNGEIVVENGNAVSELKGAIERIQEFCNTANEVRYT